MQTRQYVRRVLVGGTMLGALTAAVLSTANAHDDERQALLARLNHLTTLEADFTQQVTDAQGELVQQLHGHLALARPNLLYWQSDAPDEMVMVADGQKDRKSTRLNSSHVKISYAVFCLKKKK